MGDLYALHTGRRSWVPRRSAHGHVGKYITRRATSDPGDLATRPKVRAIRPHGAVAQRHRLLRCRQVSYEVWRFAHEEEHQGVSAGAGRNHFRGSRRYFRSGRRRQQRRIRAAWPRWRGIYRRPLPMRWRSRGVAAPAAISDKAQILMLGRHGYEVYAQGTNGFVCVVQRSWRATSTTRTSGIPRCARRVRQPGRGSLVAAGIPGAYALGFRGNDCGADGGAHQIRAAGEGRHGLHDVAAAGHMLGGGMQPLVPAPDVLLSD